jgi:crotonobetainyl-CoA:carnitine CoA-transferase CaiB-like acyl-CoA transferase
VVIAIKSDAQWQTLAQQVGGTTLAADPRFLTTADRLQNQAELDRIIGAWTLSREMRQVSQQLQALGLAASPVLRGPDLLTDPHYAERQTFHYQDHPQVGFKWYQGFAWRVSATPGAVHWPAPTLGQHNFQVYHELLGLTPAEIQELEETGVIGTRPTGSRII